MFFLIKKSFYFKLEDNYFTIFWWFLLYISMDQTYKRVPCLLNLPPASLPTPPLWDVRSTSPCCIAQQAPTGWLFCMWSWVLLLSFSTALSSHRSLFLPCCDHESVLYVCISFAALQIYLFYILRP